MGVLISAYCVFLARVSASRDLYLLLNWGQCRLNYWINLRDRMKNHRSSGPILDFFLEKYFKNHILQLYRDRYALSFFDTNFL